MKNHALRALLRIERRHVRKNPLRSLLIAALVAVPTAAMVGGSALITALTRTVEDQQHEAMGLASLQLHGSAALSIDAAARSLPTGIRSEALHSGVAVVARPGQRLLARSYHVAPSALEAGGLACTMLRIDQGRAPKTPSEAALSRRLLDTLHFALGDTVEVDGRSLVITGIATVPEQLQLPVVVLYPQSTPSELRHTLLVDLPPADAARIAAHWSAQGGRPQLRANTGSGDSFEAVVVFVCGSFGFFEAALVIGAAMAVGMRRRQRELGLLGSNGAERGPVVAALLLSTGAQAALGSAIGVATGAGAAYLVHPHLSGWVGRDVGGFELPLKYVFGSFLLGVLSAVLSAWLPARATVRLPVRVALSGRRPIQAGSRGFLRAGMALVALGTLSVAGGSLMPGKLSGIAILAGAIALVLGLGSLSPWILEVLARGAGRLPIPWRLAVRDAGRFRARNGPVVTAVIAGMSISVLLGCIGASVNQLQSAQRPLLEPNELGIEGPRAEDIAHSLQREFGGEASMAPASRQRSAPAASAESGSWLVTLPSPVTRELAETAITMAAAYPQSSISATALEPQSGESIFSIILWICIATGLVVIFVATTLSSVESAADSKILRTVGASPGVLRQHVASRAAYLALLGCMLAVPAGLVPMAGLLRLSGGTLSFVMPWSTLAVAVFAMPLIGFAGTWWFTLLRPPGQGWLWRGHHASA